MGDKGKRSDISENLAVIKSKAAEGSIHQFQTCCIDTMEKILDSGDLVMRRQDAAPGIEACIKATDVTKCIENVVDQFTWSSFSCRRFEGDGGEAIV